jgi:hypothetical protein
MSYVTLDEVRNHMVHQKLTPGLSLELPREQYLQLQQFILDAQGTRRGRLDQDLERARCIYLHLPEPRFPTWYPPSNEGMRSATGKSRQWLVIPNGSVVRAVLGGRRRPRVQIHGYVRPGRWSGDLCIPLSGEQDLVFSTFGGAASTLAERLGYYGRRSGMLTFEMEWRPGQWVQLEALRPVRFVRR